MTGEFLQNYFFNRLWPETTIIAEFAIKNCIDSTSQTSESSSQRPKQAKSVILFYFSHKKIDQNFLRYGQSLLKRYNHLSRVSSIPIGCLHI